ncbi:unnamed protein product [Paramecium sonneborni]|uniref:Uncharacterized protein n=1 Tax=Paramecium sonneborni TaxID=65129 RepID=A0A8S1R5Q6_9CILI|nr:unnamed protein product [Paramecium sonneborni]
MRIQYIHQILYINQFQIILFEQISIIVWRKTLYYQEKCKNFGYN